MKIKYLFFVFIAIALITSCEDLDVEDINTPTKNDLLLRQTAEEIYENYGSLYNQWFLTTQAYEGLGLSLWQIADAGTSSWGGSGFRDFSSEPRVVFNNTASYSNMVVVETPYKSLYKTLFNANDLIYITEIKNKEVIYNNVNQNKMLNAYARFNQGIALGYLGLLFDKAFIVTETTDLLEDIPTSSYKDIIAKSLECLDKAIEICESETFTIPAEWVPGVTLNQETFGQLVNSYAARILAYSPRNETENESLDWNRVYNYASNGIDFDFAPLADDVDWYSEYQIYANYSGLSRADMRIVNMMDPDMPNHWPELEYPWPTTLGYELLPDPKTTVEEAYDDRLITDFEYLSTCNFYPERGLYYFSCYRFTRRDQYLSTWTEPMPEMLKAENDLLLAEAALMTEKYTEAANIINNGTRVIRGGLPAISETAEEIKAAIFHERNIELFCTGLGVEYFTMRKANQLYYGTLLHFPIPAAELETLGMDLYTFGPEVGIAGTDYSTGGWELN